MRIAILCCVLLLTASFAGFSQSQRTTSNSPKVSKAVGKTVSKKIIKKTKPPMTAQHPAPPPPTVITWTPAQHQAAQDALKSLRRLHAAATIGVTSHDYHDRLIDTSADVAEDLRQVPQDPGPVYKNISDAMQAYVDASTLWEKVTTAANSLTSTGGFSVDQSINAVKGSDVDKFNTDPQISSIQTHYSLPVVAVDVSAMQASLDKYKSEIAIFDAFSKANTSDDPQINAQITTSKLHCAERLRDRDLAIEQTALNAYSVPSLSAIWAVADQLEQKADDGLLTIK